jgi:hypothetical protein
MGSGGAIAFLRIPKACTIDRKVREHGAARAAAITHKCVVQGDRGRGARDVTGAM